MKLYSSGASEALKQWGIQKWAWQEVEQLYVRNYNHLFVTINQKVENGVSQSHSFLITFLEKLYSEANVALHGSLITIPKSDSCAV